MRLIDVKKTALLKLQAAEAVTDPLFEIDLLLGHLLGRDRAWLYIHEDFQLTSEQEQRLTEWVARRQQGYPMAYILGGVEFYGRRFIVQEGVLVPRPETELLVEAVMQILTSPTWAPRQGSATKPLRIVDLGAGSGIIGITLAHLLPKTEIHLLEPSVDAWACLTKNLELHPFEDRVSAHLMDAETFLNGVSAPFDLIVSNPPYIALDDLGVDPWVKQWEPHQALFAGSDGLDCYRRWIPLITKVAEPHSILAFEHGSTQGEDVTAILRQYHFDVLARVLDYQGYWRHTIASRSSRFR
ncbi:MAG: peptide chain release factor N(5)-glutamine methyltransferase [Bdellovibrionaceae bacterium]|jgi:release factor glutamine methyltransferase|nr:peptide chain release factor N(5)-glutamine methyltransferase [Pseudobdellovibrionaceae bacterium]